MTGKNISIIWTIQIVLLLSVYCIACTPCEENTICEIAYTSEYDENLPNSLIWKLDGVDVCTCYTTNDKECIIYPQFQQKIKASIQLENGTVTSTIKVLNATRPSGSTGSKWEEFAYYDGDAIVLMHTCNLKIYKKINNATCDYQATHNGLNITCLSTNAYPESACEFSFKIDNINQHYELSPFYKNTVVKQDPVYYKSVCTVEIAKEKLKPGLLEIETIIFPNFYKNGTNCKFCNSGHIFHFNLTIGFTCSAINKFGYLTKVNYSIALNNQTTLLEKRYTVDRLNICSNQCFGDDKFCLNGKVNLCDDAELEEMQEWCRAQNNSFIEAMKSNRCKRECQYFLKMQKLEEIRKQIDLVFSNNTYISVAVILFCIIIIGVGGYVLKYVFFKRIQNATRQSIEIRYTPIQFRNDMLQENTSIP